MIIQVSNFKAILNTLEFLKNSGVSSLLCGTTEVVNYDTLSQLQGDGQRRTIPQTEKDAGKPRVHYVDELCAYMLHIQAANPDIRSYVRYDRPKADFLLDLHSYMMVEFRVQEMDRWHEMMIKALHNYPAYENFDLRLGKRMVEMHMTKLGFHPGGMKAAMKWYNEHKQSDYCLPKNIQPIAKNELPVTLANMNAWLQFRKESFSLQERKKFRLF